MNARAERIAVTCAAAMLAAIGGRSATAQEPQTAAKTCVYLADIDHTQIVDQRNILFYMRNHSVLQNSFREPCYGLHEKSRFTYGSASLKRLCAGNMIAVLTDLSFGAVAASNTCKLGMFLPLDPDEVEDLLIAAGKDKGGSQKKQAIKSQPVALPQDAASDAAPKPQPAENAAPAPPAAPDGAQR